MGASTLPVTPGTDASTGETRVITILSPKGGAGKTTVATNLAVGLAQRHPRQVVLVDLDLQFGDVANNLRLRPKTTIYDIARNWPVDSTQVKLALTGHHSGLFTLCAPNNPAEADEVNSTHVYGALRALKRTFKYVVVDTDPGLSERVLAALDESNDIVMVCSKEIPSIRGLRKALEALDTIGMTEATRWFLLNRADTKVGLELDEVERMISRRVDVAVPSSLDMVLATNDGVPIIESGKNPACVRAFEQLCDLVDESGTAGSEMARQARGLFRRKG